MQSSISLGLLEGDDKGLGLELQFEIRRNPAWLDWGDIGSGDFSVGILICKVANQVGKLFGLSAWCAYIAQIPVLSQHTI